MAIDLTKLKTSQKILLLVGGVLVLILVVLGAGKVQQFGKMTLTRVSPTPSDQKVSVVDAVTFTFNHPLAADMTKNFEITPHVAGKTKISGGTLTFTPDYSYGYDTNYTATLKDPVSTGGLKSETVSTTFMARLLEDKDLTKKQQQDLSSRDDVILNDPLVGALPADTLNYRLDFTVDKTTGQISYHAQLNIYNKYPNDPASTAKYNQDLQRYKKEVLDFISSKGKDPAKLYITWDPAEAGDQGGNTGSE